MTDNTLEIGVSVNIQRTDGRIHSAIVSSINIDTKYVTVEWYEKSEAKGKEIDFQSVFSLNPGIKPPQHSSSSHTPKHRAKNSSKEPVQISKTENDQPVENPRRQRNLANEPDSSSVNLAPSKIPVGSSIVITNSTEWPGNHDEDTERPEILTESSHELRKPRNIPSIRPNIGQPIISSTTNNHIINAQNSVRGSFPAAGDQTKNTTPNGKSVTVKEIEKIQQRRDERRAAQRALRENNQPDIDSTNPNYEFYQMIRDFQKTIEFKPLAFNDVIESNQITVCVRKRPMNSKESARREIDVITIPHHEVVYVHEPKVKVDLTKFLENQEFHFDYAFDETADNNLVYQYTARPLVESIFERGMATCFAYGQTGSGKTHTMGGEFKSKSAQDVNNGIYALAAQDVFRIMDSKYAHENFLVEAAFFEIYGGKVFDLLNKKNKLRVLEDGKNQVQIVGLRTDPVYSVDEVLTLLQNGTHIRTSGTTSANQHSSRSHAVFQMILKKDGKLHGKFSLIDLAGNERGADTSSADRGTRMEGAEINKSLLALKECIRALGRKGAHLPFRASKLTQVLRDSFIGDRSKTCMIAMISPSKESCEHTLNTLRYADRVKELGPGKENHQNMTVDDWTGAGNAASKINTTITTANSGGRSVHNVPLKHQKDLVSSNGYNRMSTIQDADLVDDDELAILKSVDDGNDDVYTLQKVLKSVNQTEEDINDYYRDLCQKISKWPKDHFKNYSMMNRVQYDSDLFIVQTSKYIRENIADLTILQNKLNEWNNQLRQEEEISRKMNQQRK